MKQSEKKLRTRERVRDMGKYIRKPKTAMDLAVKDVSQLYLGVLTRSRTRALQQLQSLLTAAADDSPPAPNPDFLELRSRRLERTPFIRKKSKNSRKRRAPKRRFASRDNESPQLESSTSTEKSCSEPAALSIEPAALPIEPVALPIVPAEEEDGGSENPDGVLEIGGSEIEASLGENNLGLEAGESMGTRESTPSSLIMPAGSVTTPGSSTRPGSVSPRAQVVRRDIATREVDDFFARIEQSQQRRFTEKYNFDFVNDMPLSGRYEWVKIEP